MGKKRSAGVGPRRPFERLPDDIVLRILAQAADPNGLPVDKGFAQVQRLCQFRTVCTRFDRLVPYTERLLCTNANHAEQVVSFLQETKAAKALRLNTNPVPQLVLQALLGAAPRIERLLIFDGFRHHQADQDQMLQGMFRSLSMCAQLKQLELNLFAGPFNRALSSRHTLTNLVTLTLDHVDMEDACLSSMLRACSCLKALVVRQAWSLKNIAMSSGSLTSLEFDMSGDIVVEVADSLEIQAPQLLRLKIVSVESVVINAPNLLALELDRIAEIKVLSAWKVCTVKIQNGLNTFRRVMEVLNLCGDAKEVTVRRAWSTVPQDHTDRATLSSLLRPFNLKQLEGLEISSVVPECLLEEQEPDLSLAHLKKLKIGFRKLDRMFDLCSTFIKLSQQLERFMIDLTNVVEGEVAINDLVVLVLRLQKLHPQLNLTVEWPRRCII